MLCYPELGATVRHDRAWADSSALFPKPRKRMRKGDDLPLQEPL